MSKFNAEIEARITEAIRTISREKRPNLSKLAREFAVPYSKLRHRVKGRKSLVQRQPTSRKLNEAQELAF